MKLAIIVQRYGDEVVGGAEIHARLVAEVLAERHEVQVLTSTAVDYRSFRNAYPPGPDQVGGLSVLRFPVEREREQKDFDDLANRCCWFEHTLQDEKLWVEAHGPVCPELLEYLRLHHSEYDRLIFFCYRYWTTVHGLQIAPEKSLLVPTAEHDRVIYFEFFRRWFQLPRAIVYNSVEERQLIQGVTGNRQVDGQVVGVGIRELSPAPEAEIRHKYDLTGPYFIYVGRIEREKGCLDLASHWIRLARETQLDAQLVFVGRRVDKVPDHPALRYLGVVDDEDKLSLMAAAHALIMPSRHESLSMVLLESWFLQRPVLANADCEVLRGQVYRSNGGLVYRDYPEFAEGIRWMLGNPEPSAQLGQQGHDYFDTHYRWPIIQGKFDQLLALEPKEPSWELARLEERPHAIAPRFFDGKLPGPEK